MSDPTDDGEAWAARVRSATTEILAPDVVANLSRRQSMEPRNIRDLCASHEALREMAGQHDQTGADHMEQMWQHAQRADAAEAEVVRLRAHQEPASDDVIRDLVAAAAGLSPGANPTAAGRFADALRSELNRLGLEIVHVHPPGGTT
jgi:hypothetical protein